MNFEENLVFIPQLQLCVRGTAKVSVAASLSPSPHLSNDRVTVTTERCHSSLSKPHMRSDNKWKRKDKAILSLNHCLDEIKDLQNKVVRYLSGVPEQRHTHR